MARSRRKRGERREPRPSLPSYLLVPDHGEEDVSDDPTLGLGRAQSEVVLDTLNKLGFEVVDYEHDTFACDAGWSDDSRWVSDQLQYWEQWLAGVRRMARVRD